MNKKYTFRSNAFNNLVLGMTSIYEKMQTSFFFILCALDVSEASHNDGLSCDTPTATPDVIDMNDNNLSIGTDVTALALHLRLLDSHSLEDNLKIEETYYRNPCNFFTIFYYHDILPNLPLTLSQHKICVSIYCSFSFLDSKDVYKGSMLYATPHNCNLDHSVIIISTFKGEAICLAPLYLIRCLVNPNLLKTYFYQFIWVAIFTPSITHLDNIINNRLMHDIEVNPGPIDNVQLKVITLNCRGLNNIDKCRLLFNRLIKIVDGCAAVVMLQETMISTNDYVTMAWRGKHVHTPGHGNSQGCITLLPSTVEIIATEHLGNRGHCVLVKGLTANDNVAIYNIYAPNGFGHEKAEFFDSVFEKLRAFDDNIILGGDFNTTLNDSDRHNRGVTAAEMHTASSILDNVAEQNLTDTWNGIHGYTWRRGQIMSKLDRIFYRFDSYILRSNTVDWTVTTSDHAAVIAIFEHNAQPKHRNEHVKLDNEIIKNPLFLNEIRDYIVEQLGSASHMNPHLKLEFFKMTVRTITLAIMKRERRREISELAEINDDIVTHTNLLSRPQTPTEARDITIELENLNHRKEQLLQTQGAKLAQYAKSRWYNDGEKSNKYFLNLLKRRSHNNEMDKLIVNGTLTTNSNHIRNEVTSFYKQLYNSTEMVENSDHLLRHMFTVTDEENNYMARALTLDELWANLKNTKATTPGPDGMSNTYLKKLWSIAGPLILNAWNYSLEIGELPPSHKTSILRLIPKQGKDKTQIKNWRPITLSNCDHKLITRSYNSRLLLVIKEYITPTQTAYIKGRNISDNLRMLNSAVKLTELEDDLNGIIIALDAQKAFDSVNHDYIAAVLERCALTSFIPFFRLLYKGLKNDIIINGKIGEGYDLKNGVKQGDALSCSLFILAIEPVLRNIMANDNITPLRSGRIGYTWPKILGYADDLTIITNNNDRCIDEVFVEYEHFTKASGLKLNADKTELFPIQGGNLVPDLDPVPIKYLNQQYNANRLNSIKINGIIFSTDRSQMQAANLKIMIEKMNRHFSDWSKRSLSLLGKIQIIKTFGLSQYLYTLAVINLEAKHWKLINKLIYKFIWNKNINAAPAPHRISKEVMLTPVEQGGFGLVDLESVMKASRIKRFSHLLEHNMHPIANLQNTLCSNNITNVMPIVNIEDVTTTVLITLHRHYIEILNNVADYYVETDVNLRNIILNIPIKYLCLKNKVRGRDLATLTRRQIYTVQQAIMQNDNSLTLTLNILNPNLQRHVRTLQDAAATIQLPALITAVYIYDKTRNSMVRAAQLHSRAIRQSLVPTKYLNITKRLNTSVENSKVIYSKISTVRSTQNKTKLLRLIHGDVYCNARLKKFRLSDNDRCNRCFAEETIQHLLLDCPYTKEVWRKLGINPASLNDILSNTDRVNIEIVSHFLSEIMFRKKVLPTEVLIRTTYTSYAKGLCRNKRVIELATSALNAHQITGSWNMRPNNRR